MYVLTVQLSIKREQVEDFLRELSALRALIEREPDCLRFDVLQDAACPESIMLVEAWTSRDYFEQVQLKRPYYTPYLARVQPTWAKDRRMQHWHAIT
ncbi:putative quinol monooxygenase [Dyella dinghuensis]|uniref:putative quinol monooxygenase n=1 Tax=Dyella dinghuensis TaxID=1920169 RepID=UPI0013156916|nr:antibiotic biosynthesis monooxygenase [Dyella dinghuensis]